MEHEGGVARNVLHPTILLEVQKLVYVISMSNSAPFSHGFHPEASVQSSKTWEWRGALRRKIDTAGGAKLFCREWPKPCK